MDPTDTAQVAGYASSFRYSDPEQFRKLAADFIATNPMDVAVSRLLGMMADDCQSPMERVRLLERMQTQLVGGGQAPDFADEYENRIKMWQLFLVYAGDEPEKALNFAREMRRAFPKDEVSISQRSW
jgi:hypothetical protein